MPILSIPLIGSKGHSSAAALECPLPADLVSAGYRKGRKRGSAGMSAAG